MIELKIAADGTVDIPEHLCKSVNLEPNKQDIYLYVAAFMPGLQDAILKHYDPAAPTPEGIAAAKRHCKRERTIAKVVVLACGYGAGVRKIHQTLVMAGIDVTFTQVNAIHAAYWRLFAGVRAWDETLQSVWRSTGGWLPTLFGTPTCVPDNLLKDCVNRVVQTSGHQFLQVWIWHIDRLRTERAVPMTPYIVDLHDETLWTAPRECADAAAAILSDALAAANAELQLDIAIKSEPMIAADFAQIKIDKPDYALWAKENAA